MQNLVLEIEKPWSLGPGLLISYYFDYSWRPELIGHFYLIDS
jgi:hypothetical protein